MKDVATVHDGFVPQTNIVRTNGSRGVLLTVTRNGKASTLAIVNAVKNALPRIMGRVPQDLKLSVFGDQSLFVRVGDRRRGARDVDCGGADGRGDSAVPGQLAQHADRVHLDPAVDTDVDLHL